MYMKTMEGKPEIVGIIIITIVTSSVRIRINLLFRALDNRKKKKKKQKKMKYFENKS